MISDKTFCQETVKRRSLALARLARRANLYGSDAVIKALNTSAWSSGTRNIALMAYKDYLKMRGLPIPQMPYYHECAKLPYIPLESELDQLISGMRPWRACLLKLLKDTGLRPIEAWRLKWTDLDIVQKTVSIPATKRGNPRRLRVSEQWINKTSALPRKHAYIFSKSGIPRAPPICIVRRHEEIDDEVQKLQRD